MGLLLRHGPTGNIRAQASSRPCRWQSSQGLHRSLLRRTHTDYLTSSTFTDYDSGAHSRNLPKEQWVSTGLAGNNKLSRSLYEYPRENRRQVPLAFVLCHVDYQYDSNRKVLTNAF